MRGQQVIDLEQSPSPHPQIEIQRLAVNDFCFLLWRVTSIVVNMYFLLINNILIEYLTVTIFVFYRGASDRLRLTYSC
jgi:hypothetical protein